MNSNDTTIIQKTKDKIAIGAKELALIVGLSVALYFPGRLIVAWGHDAINWAKLTARRGLAEIVAWDMGYFDYGLDHKSKLAASKESYTLTELQGILYRVTIRNQNLEYTLKKAKEEVVSMQITLDIDEVPLRLAKNN